MANSLENHFLTFVLCAILSLVLSGVEGSTARPLFAFGDSYADTGNTNMSDGGSWAEPYGITWPTVPSGRFSNGHILTDFLAIKYLRAKKSPVPYSIRTLHPNDCKRYGVNFAVGGTGVFTETKPPSLTTQVDSFQEMLSGKDGVHIDTDLANAVAFVSIAGNDYNAFLKSGASLLGLPTELRAVVSLMGSNLERLVQMGFGMILVSGLEPLGCAPELTASINFTECIELFNWAVVYHNIRLREAVDALNKQTPKPTIHILNLYDTFFAAYKAPSPLGSGLRFKTPLKPCCFGSNADAYCGTVDENGNKEYTLCDVPRDAFYWDGVHPTQAAWEFMFPILKANLQQSLLNQVIAYGDGDNYQK